MQPIEYEPCASKMVDQVVPALSVFHTPPEPTATYHVCRLSGWMTMSLMRPAMMAGPMLRKARPARSPSLRSGVLAAGAAALALGLGAGVWPGTAAVKNARAVKVTIRQ